MNNEVFLVVIYSFRPRMYHVITSRAGSRLYTSLARVMNESDALRCSIVLVYKVTDRTKWPSTK